MRGADCWRRAALLKAASKRVWGADHRQLWSIDLKLSWASDRARSGAKLSIFSRRVVWGDRKDIGVARGVERSRICSRAFCVPIPIGFNLTRFPTVRQGFNPLPHCGFGRLVDTYETAPTYK
ncbi:hypothetical protein AVDCRST_MAG84-1509 [uncultured Microcoleus sp.]|uniref:Uncharacterized protein n=1 Tax=uncultured Microcoleus sp. TaxID=259945 RepID=A0A6J4L7Z0_9CYAN|nr:hypothetical protein AVDCRST_MAG84-1509 [uncultured Microcoleus sp.]